MQLSRLAVTTRCNAVSRLRGGQLPRNGILQQYIDAKGGHSATTRVDYEPMSQNAVRATNTHPALAGEDAAATFDDSSGLVKFAAVKNLMLGQELAACARWIASHLHAVFAETIKVTRFSAFFRQDPGDRLWLSFVTNMAYEGPLPSTQMPAKVVAALFDSDALWDTEKAKLDKSLKRFSESEELQSPSVLRQLTKSTKTLQVDNLAESAAALSVSPEEEWLDELQMRRPNLPIPRGVHGMIKLVANQCPSCGAKLRQNQGDTSQIPKVPRKTLLLHYQQLLTRLAIKPFDMSYAQEKQMEGNLTAVKKPSKFNFWPGELESQLAAGGVGLYGVFARSLEQDEHLNALRSFGKEEAELKLVVREVPPAINLLQPGLGGPELQGLRKDPAWLLEGIEVCSECFPAFDTIIQHQLTADSRGFVPAQVLGAPASQKGLDRPKSLRIKQELAARRENRQVRLQEVQRLQKKLRQHIAKSSVVDGTEAVQIGSLALSSQEATLAAELYQKGKIDDSDVSFGGTCMATPIGFDSRPGAELEPVTDAALRESDPLAHMLESVQWATADMIHAREEIKPSGERVQSDSTEILGGVQERNRLRHEAFRAQVKAFEKYQAAKDRATEAWRSRKEPAESDLQLLAAGPPATPSAVAAAALQRSATAPLGMTRKQRANAAWQTKQRSLSRSSLSETAGHIERAKIVAKSTGGTTFAQPRGVVLTYGRASSAGEQAHSAISSERPEFTNQVGPGAMNLLSTWIASTQASGGPDAKLATIGSGKVSDPALAKVFGKGKQKRVRRNPFLSTAVVPAQGTHRSMFFTPVTRPYTSPSLSQTQTTRTARLPLLLPPSARDSAQTASQQIPQTSPIKNQAISAEWESQQQTPNRQPVPSTTESLSPSDGKHAKAEDSCSPSSSSSSPVAAATAATEHRSSPRSEAAKLGATGRSLLPDLQAASVSANSLTFQHFPSSKQTRQNIITKHKSAAAAAAAAASKVASPRRSSHNPHTLGPLLSDEFISAAEDLTFRTNSIESAYSHLSKQDEKAQAKIAQRKKARAGAQTNAAADAYMAASTIRKENASALCESMLEAEVERQRRLAELERQRQQRRQDKELAMRMSVSQGRPAADSRLRANSESKLALGGVEEAMLYSADALNIRVGEGFTRMPSRFAIEAEKRRRHREVQAQQRAAAREGADTGEIVLTEEEKMLAGVLGSSKISKPDAASGILACKLQVAKLGEFRTSAADDARKNKARVWLLVVRRASIGEYQPTHEQAVIGMASLSSLRDFGAGQGGPLGDDPEMVRRAALELAGAKSKQPKSTKKEKRFSVSKSDIHNVEVMWGRGMYCMERLDVQSGAVTREYMSRHDLWSGAERDPLLLQAKRSELMWKSTVEGAGIDFLASQFCVRVLPPVSVNSAATELAVLPPHPVQLGPWKDHDEHNELVRLRRGATSAYTHEGRRRIFDKRRQLGKARMAAMSSAKEISAETLLDEYACIQKSHLLKQTSRSQEQESSKRRPINARLARWFGTLEVASWITNNFPTPEGTEDQTNIPPVDPALGSSCWPHLPRPRSPDEPPPSASMLASQQGPGGAWPSDVAAAMGKVCIIPHTVEGVISGGTFYRRGAFHTVFLRGHSSAHPVESKPFTLFHYNFMTGKARCVRLSFYDLITDEVIKEIPELVRPARCFYANLVLSMTAVLKEEQLVSRPQTAPVFRIAHIREPTEDEDIETRNLKKHTDVAIVPAKFQRGSLASMVKMHGRGMMYYTLRADEQYPHTFSVRTHSIGERKNTSRDLAQRSVESPDDNPFISSFAKPLVTAFGLDVGRQILAARIRHIDDVPWLLALCVGPPQSSRTYGPLQARTDLLSAHFELKNPARAESPRGDRDGYDISRALQQKADMDDTLGTFFVLTVRLERRGEWTERGHCTEFPDRLPTSAHEGADPETFGSIELSYGKAATATLNPLLEHAGNAPPPTAIKLEQKQRKLERDYYLQQGAVVNEDEFIKQAMDKAQMLASMEQVDIEKRFRDSARPRMLRAVDAAIGYASGKIGEKPSIGLDSVFTQFSGDDAFNDTAGGGLIR